MDRRARCVDRRAEDFRRPSEVLGRWSEPALPAHSAYLVAPAALPAHSAYLVAPAALPAPPAYLVAPAALPAHPARGFLVELSGFADPPANNLGQASQLLL